MYIVPARHKIGRTTRCSQPSEPEKASNEVSVHVLPATQCSTTGRLAHTVYSGGAVTCHPVGRQPAARVPIPPAPALAPRATQSTPPPHPCRQHCMCALAARASPSPAMHPATRPLPLTHPSCGSPCRPMILRPQTIRPRNPSHRPFGCMPTPNPRALACPLRVLPCRTSDPLQPQGRTLAYGTPPATRLVVLMPSPFPPDPPRPSPPATLRALTVVPRSSPSPSCSSHAPSPARRVVRQRSVSRLPPPPCRPQRPEGPHMPLRRPYFALQLPPATPHIPLRRPALSHASGRYGTPPAALVALRRNTLPRCCSHPPPPARLVVRQGELVHHLVGGVRPTGHGRQVQRQQRVGVLLQAKTVFYKNIQQTIVSQKFIAKLIRLK